MPGLLQNFQRVRVHEFIFERDDIAALGKFHQRRRLAPVAEDGIGREPRGGAEGVFLQHHDLAAERQRGDGRHARKLAAADDAEPHRDCFWCDQRCNF